MKEGEQSESGFLIAELMLVLILLGIFGLSLLRANLMSVSSHGAAEMEALASEIGAEAMEEYAGIDPINLDDADDRSDTVERGTHVFNRVVNVTVNADSSRTIVVTIASQNPRYTTSVTFQNRFAKWGSL